MLPTLLLVALVVLLVALPYSVKRQVTNHHIVRERRRQSSRELLAVHPPNHPKHPHTPAGGLPAHR